MLIVENLTRSPPTADLGLDLRANLYQKSIGKRATWGKTLLGPLASGLAKGVIFYYSFSCRFVGLVQH